MSDLLGTIYFFATLIIGAFLYSALGYEECTSALELNAVSAILLAYFYGAYKLSERVSAHCEAKRAARVKAMIESFGSESN